MKLKKLILLAVSVSSVFVASSVAIVGNFGNIIGNNQNSSNNGGGPNNGNNDVKPILKDNITFTGPLNSIIKSDGRSEDVDANLKNLFNNDKKLLLSDDEVNNKLDLEKLSYEPKILEWDNWGVDTYQQWISKNKSVEQLTYNKDDKIVFSSKNELKTYLNTNLNTMINNSQGATIDGVDFGVDETGNLLIPIQYQKTGAAQLYSSRASTKAVLKISPDKIDFHPKIQVSGTYGDSQTIEQKDLTLNCTVTNISHSKISFKQGVEKSTITLDNKNNTENEIGLWTYIKDEDILKKLGWLDNNKTLENHIDGTEIDSSKLMEDVIYNDLNINKNNEELLDVQIVFNNNDGARNPSNDNYDGKYKILIDTIDKTNTDINLNFKSYEVLSNITGNSPLQLQVPNAYVLDTTINTNKNYRLTTKKSQLSNVVKLLDSPFELGRKNISDVNNLSIARRNFINGNNISRVFTNNLYSAQKNNKDVIVFNGISINYQTFTFTIVPETNNDILKMEMPVVLKPGFVFKEQFSFKSKKYNSSLVVENKKLIFEIATAWDASDNQGHPFYANPNKTPDQRNAELERS